MPYPWSPTVDTESNRDEAEANKENIVQLSVSVPASDIDSKPLRTRPAEDSDQMMLSPTVVIQVSDVVMCSPSNAVACDPPSPPVYIDLISGDIDDDDDEMEVEVEEQLPVKDDVVATAPLSVVIDNTIANIDDILANLPAATLPPLPSPSYCQSPPSNTAQLTRRPAPYDSPIASLKRNAQNSVISRSPIGCEYRHRIATVTMTTPYYAAANRRAQLMVQMALENRVKREKLDKQSPRPPPVATGNGNGNGTSTPRQAGIIRNLLSQTKKDVRVTFSLPPTDADASDAPVSPPVPPLAAAAIIDDSVAMDTRAELPTFVDDSSSYPSFVSPVPQR